MFSALRCHLLAAAALLLAQSALAGAPSPGKPRQQSIAPARPATTSHPATTLLALATTAATGPEAARQPVLTGVVLRPDGQPCPGAAVYVAGAARELVVTDAQGAFRLPVGPAGRPVTVLADYLSLGSTRLVVASPGSQPLRLTLGQ